MKSKDLQIALIKYIDLFEKENPHLGDYEIEDFLSFMESALYVEKVAHPTRQIGGSKKPEGVSLKGSSSELLSRQISLIYRYAKEYTKKALADSGLQTIEEFSFLVVLMTFEHLSKTELILKNVMSKTSGVEVIKRLLRKGLIHQFADINDKRSQLVAITPEGMKEMRKIFPKMQMATEIMNGNLSDSEQRTLLFLLQKLESYHNTLFLNHKDDGLQELMEINKK